MIPYRICYDLMHDSDCEGRELACRRRRDRIPERCNSQAWRTYPNGYRVCLAHARPNDPDEELHPNSVGPCDYPMDGLDDAPYRTLGAEARP
jgi:hypothetical protein